MWVERFVKPFFALHFSTATPGRFGWKIHADGMLYCLGEKGKMGLIEAQPKQLNQVSTFDLPPGDGPSWTHPVISDGKLYLRWNDKLYVYLLKA